MPAYITPKPVNELREQAHVVTNEDDRCTKSMLNRPEGFHDMPLNHHIEGAGRFVGDDHLWRERD